MCCAARCLLALLVVCPLLLATVRADDGVPAVLRFEMQSLDGKPVKLEKYRGRVVLFVNVASECGYTPQYAGLEALHQKYAARGLSVVGVPANEFGGQEPGSNRQIAEFCEQNYGVSFDMLAKVVVDGTGTCPLYAYLTSKETNPKFGGPIRWNFEKFLVGRDGTVLARFGSGVEPDAPELLAALEAALAQPQP